MNQDERRAYKIIVEASGLPCNDSRDLLNKTFTKFIKFRNGKICSVEQIVKDYHEFVLKIDGELID